MSKERELIEIINKNMPRSKTQVNKLFESDAEIVDFNSNKLLFNIDEFSEEDMLREEDPFVLGWNMAVGSMSDILASGGKPKYYAHSLVIKKSWSKEYIDKLSAGIAEVLKKSNTDFIGGDLGSSDIWRYTGSVIGELQGEPLLRSSAAVGDYIFISGKIGLGNIEAALKLYSDNSLLKPITNKFKNLFSLRIREAELIKKYSRCCMDTSDGVFNTLNTICEISENGFEVRDLPYEKSGFVLSKLLRVPIELLFLGECGEYELLFTISKENYEEFLEKTKERGLTFYQIGEIKERNSKLLYVGDKSIDLSTFKLSARDYEDVKQYLKDVIDFVKLRR